MKWPEVISELGRIQIDRRQLERWSSGDLPQEWSSRYPFLFDSDDLRLTRTQDWAHFYEWLAAILLHHTTGYLSLVEKYEFKAHARKQEVVNRLLAPELLDLVRDQAKGAQCPDLLMYAPDLSDWFFCEAKGPTDRLRPNQRQLFDRLASASGKPIRILRFRF